VQGRWWILLFVIAVCIAGAVALMIWLAMGGFIEGGPTLAFGKGVGLIEIEGTIVNPVPIVEEIDRFAKDDDVAAIVVRIESPGGIVAAAQEIYSELRKASQAGKPVVASMGGVAASGGYYVACGADSIVANPGTLTGSIGVIMSFANTEELLRKIGVGFEVIKTGEYKDLGSMTRPLTPAERKLVGDLLDDVYDQFLEVISTQRGIDLEEVRKFADGRLLTGRQAYELGLVDRLGDFRDAINLAGELAGIKGEPVIIKPRKKVISLWKIIEDLVSATSSFRSGVALEYSLR